MYSDAESGNLVVSATVPLFASGTTTLLGIALADVRLSDTSSFISTLSMGVCCPACCLLSVLSGVG